MLKADVECRNILLSKTMQFQLLLIAIILSIIIDRMYLLHIYFFENMKNHELESKLISIICKGTRICITAFEKSKF